MREIICVVIRKTGRLNNGSDVFSLGRTAFFGDVNRELARGTAGTGDSGIEFDGD
ncbi:hypothetical protein BMS3Bbin11_01088 [bacterium BMS3Bbin11]|nr:hypothetical protein BMS3Bbin11_01088 [bacterium BMS3Bbin11]